MPPPTDELLDQEPDGVERPVSGDADHLDRHQHEHHRDGIVEPGFSLERQRKLAREAHPAQQREHRRAVGRGQDRAEQEPLGNREVEQPAGARPAISAVPAVPIAGQRDRRSEHRPERSKPGRQAALEQDQHERDRPHQVRERVVREVDPAEPVAAHRHSQPQEQEQRRQAHPRRHGRGHHAGRQQAPAGEDQLRFVVHAVEDARRAIYGIVRVRARTCMIV